MIKLGPGIFILLPSLPEDIHSLLYAYLLQFPPFFFSFNFPEVSPFVVISSPILTPKDTHRSPFHLFLSKDKHVGYGKYLSRAI